ncbi:phospholipase D1/2, partial [Tremellales sp. Uapishka_1]
MATPIHDAGKHPGPSSSVFGKFRTKVDHLASDVARLGTAVSTTLNPNHRHDEKWEKEIDAKMEAIRDGHRFRSFAGERDGNIVKWHVDGHDYFWAMSEVIDAATTSIMILDWWLSPELQVSSLISKSQATRLIAALQLRRPAALFPEWRLDRLLKKKAEQGVRIYVMVYKEVTASMSLSSKHTKHALEDLHPNISCMRHPDHSGGELVYYFSHHEKLCVADNKTAAMGGLDACFGRWDTRDHPLADVHPTEFFKSLFPGQDYNNSRIMDFQTVDNFTSNALAIQDAPRMPWHDTSMTLVGPSVVDLVQHFCERWNFVKKIKYKHDHRMEWLALPSPWGDVEAKQAENKRIADNQLRKEHPHLAEWREKGRQFAHPYHWPPSEQPRASEAVPSGTCRVQVLRSSADWSHGILLEDSIQQAYIGLIREANHFIYIENQFFITNTEMKGPVQNQIGAALAQRIIAAAKAEKKFKIIVVIPAVPAFAGDIQTQAGLKAIMESQYRSINRGGASIFEVVRAAGYEPMDYISFWNLRSYDRINTPKSAINQMEKRSGVTFHEAQVALAKVYIGSDDLKGSSDEVVNIEKPHDQSTSVDQIGQKDTVEKAVRLPKTVDEAKDVIHRFEQGAVKSDKNVSDNIGQHAMQDKTELLEEHWDGSDEEELNCLVSELCYIHSKLMIVDDRRVICGSANLNDRSQVGDHDSEIAILIEDEDLIESHMDGKKYMASRFAATWRRSLMREHLGLITAQPAWDPKQQPTEAMHAAPAPHKDEIGTEEDKLVEDVLSDEFTKLWIGRGRANREKFQKVFRPVPNDEIRTWEDYEAYLKPNAGIPTGHVADKSLSLQQVKEELAGIKGHLVDMPLDFLIGEKWMTEGNYLSVNPYTLNLYI